MLQASSWGRADRHAVQETGLSRTQLSTLLDTRPRLELSDAARKVMQQSFETLEAWIRKGVRVYGVSAGIGDLARHTVDESWQAELQLDLIESHCCGMGEPVPDRVVRGAMILRAVTLARGFSGVRPALAEQLLAMVSRGVVPVVPCNGSVGASGDTVLLAHIGAVAIGLGEARVDGGPVQSGREALADVGLEPYVLRPREGLALLNGLECTFASAVCLGEQVARLLDWTDRIAALAADSLRASPEPFMEPVQRLRGPGLHNDVARGVRECFAESRLVGQAHSPQDPYCVRCIPPVHGASREVLRHFEETVDLELEGVIDNPLVFPGEEHPRHCGHFHGQRIAMASDYLALGIVNLMNISHARVSLLLRGHEDLRPMLATEHGLANGLMATETTSASTLGRARAAAAPVSIQNIQATALQEDHVSMSWESLQRTTALTADWTTILSVEAVAAKRAAAARGRDQLGRGSRRVLDELLEATDRPTLHAELEAARAHLSAAS